MRLSRGQSPGLVTTASPVAAIPSGSTVAGGGTVTFASATPGAVLHYTLTTQYGATGDTIYSGPIALTQPWNLISIYAVAPGYQPSGAIQCTYICNMLYGDHGVGSRLLTSTTPATKATLVVLGDSRLTNIELALAQYGLGVPWGGLSHIWLFAGTGGGAWATTQYAQGGAVAVATPLGFLGTFTPRNAYRTVFANGFAPATDDTVNRLVNDSSWSPSQMAAMLPQWNGYDVYFRSITRDIAAGLTTADVYNQKRINGSTVAAYFGTPYAGVAGSPQNAIANVNIPNTFNWSADAVDLHEINYTKGAATRLGEEIWTTGGFCESTIGVTVFNCAFSGRNIDNYVNDQIFDAAVLWAEYYPLLSGQLLLWIDLGTNNPGGNSTAQHLAKLETMIAAFRVDNPNGLVMMTTAYPSSTEVPGSSPYYRDAALQLAALDPLVLVLDTHFAMPSYADAVALGWMTDTLHYNGTGRAAYAGRIAQLLAST